MRTDEDSEFDPQVGYGSGFVLLQQRFSRHTCRLSDELLLA